MKESRMLKCRFCETNADIDYVDKSPEGFWCDVCDGFTYYDGIPAHKFKLILEEKKKTESLPLNIGNCKFNKRISPLRYPGGKSKLIEYLYSKLNADNLDTFIEPYCGGASVGLALLEKQIIKRLILNDIDYGIYALFEVIKNNPQELISKINSEEINHDVYFKSKDIVNSGYQNCELLTAAWSFLLVNRLSYSGINKANPLGGRSGSLDSLLSRWNPKNITNRILKIHNISDKYEIFNLDACNLIEEKYWLPNTTIFIDPPYYKKGKFLYNCYYHKEDHINLAYLLDSLYKGCPEADIILTYDNEEFIRNLYKYPEEEIVGRLYSA